MSETKFVVSARAVGHGKTMQLTIPTAIAVQLPQGKSTRWELSVVEDGLHYRYLGTAEPVNQPPRVEVPFVDAALAAVPEERG